MTKIDIAGVLVDNISKTETINKIDEFVKSGQPHYLVTPYSELIVFAQTNEKYKDALNKADLSLPDGIGILWAAKYLSSAGHYLLTSLLAIVFNPIYIRSVIKEQVRGSELIWDIARLASEKNYSLALVGGRVSVSALAANQLKSKFPDLKINLIVSGNVFDDQLAGEIAASNSDILLIAYSPPEQEMWLSETLARLNVKAAVGLGGTFDYIAGKRLMAPGLMHNLGLEWLWRLITQPWRLPRMWNAVPVFIWKVYKWKNKK
ncbi:MAG: WecB/TagA/CpsF family glycosyltransferase [Candidatus Doudnabacteria bacterium]|nr:WecB/TagA/CpsF family glycosyltransferase [Candidatus Doudnabacteria bacterium]